MKNFLKGVKGASPIVLGYIPIGFAFGVLAVQQGMSISSIFFMSLFIYAGSSQFIGSAMIFAGAASVSIITTAFLVNLRHLLMSASLSPYLKHVHTSKQAVISHGITDETFAVGISYAGNTKEGEKCSEGYYFGLHITSQTSWIISTVLGGFLGGLISDPTKYGIDFALSAMFIGLLFMQLKDKKDIIVAISGGVLSILFIVTGSGSFNIIIATVLAATIGVILEICNKKYFSL